jgi:hypothetical protein
MHPEGMREQREAAERYLASLQDALIFPDSSRDLRFAPIPGYHLKSLRDNGPEFNAIAYRRWQWSQPQNPLAPEEIKCFSLDLQFRCIQLIEPHRCRFMLWLESSELTIMVLYFTLDRWLLLDSAKLKSRSIGLASCAKLAS